MAGATEENRALQYWHAFYLLICKPLTPEEPAGGQRYEQQFH